MPSYQDHYKAAVTEGLARTKDMPVVSESDLSHLPIPVQKYLRVSGAIGKPRIQNFHAVFKGDFRNGLKGRWMAFRSEQCNFLDEPARLFLMNSSIYGIPAEGLHMYRCGVASMQIRIASLFQVVDAKGSEMNQGETVTFFNDLCLMAPAALMDKERIRWEEDGPLAARAWFTHSGITISARLSFDEAGNLTDFISADRFMSGDGKSFKSYPWSTPVRSFWEFGGRKVVSCADAAWHTPEGEFTYGKFNLAEIEYNVTPLDR